VPAYLASSLKDFLLLSPGEIVGTLVQQNFDAAFRTLENDANESWNQEVVSLLRELGNLANVFPPSHDWGILLEFPVPRRMKRIDVVVLAEELIFVLEFKRSVADGAAYWQAWDYALDLVDFHKPSHGRRVLPIVVSDSSVQWTAHTPHDGRVYRPRFSKELDLQQNLHDWFHELRRPGQERILLEEWNYGQYRPVPTIVEAALAIFAGMEVREIAHSHSEAANLTATVDRIIQLTSDAFKKHKAICFITGVPGAGKTLADCAQFMILAFHI
jgi:hypothetical protein